MTRLLLTLTLVVTVLGCAFNEIVIPNTNPCAVAGVMSAGGICAETLTDIKRDLTLDEWLDFLEPQEARTCVPVPGMPVCSNPPLPGTPVLLPERGPGIVLSSIDYEKQKTALDQACRALGRNCSYALKQQIRSMERMQILGKRALQMKRAFKARLQ